VGGLGELGLSAYLDRFFSSWRELGGSPHDEFQRLDTVSTTEELATAINRTADQFSAAQKEADQEVVRGVAEANTMIKEIASLNHEIMENEAYGDAANSMRDRRDLLLQSLGDLVGATNFINDKGHAVVTLSGGTTVVTGIGTQLLETQLDAATGFHNVTVEGTTNMSLADSMSGGRVKGFLDVRDKDIAGRVRELDTFALDLATAVNNVHRSNFNLNGTDNVDLFTPPGTSQGAATSLKVNAAVVSDTSLLAASSTAGGIPGNGVGAMGMADLEFEDVAGGNSRKLSASVNQILTNLGYSVRDADQATERTSLRLRQLTNLRESSSGVSIEEEMIQLTRYQRSFQAASKIISAVDDMLGIVLNI
jgi:flagellar hook-associated protein 1 FlgK